MKNKGFTLIELLVVIAIIGILSSVVLASLNTARSKGSDAAIKEDLNNIRAQAELVYSNASPNSYATVCADPNVIQGLTAAATAGGNAWTSTTNNASGMYCGSVAATWIAEMPLKTASTWWCVDNTGQSKQEASASAASVTVCP